MRKLSMIKNNCFTVKLFDVITSDDDKDKNITKTDEPIDYIFLIMEYIED